MIGRAGKMARSEAGEGQRGVRGVRMDELPCAIDQYA